MIKIQNFTGEVPRVSPRALGENAQTNRNLLATSTEFRPLMADSTVASATNGAVTLYRLSRDAAGALLSSDATGWRTETASKNYVKGQINDDITERTYVTTNDGSAAPRVIDATGQDRLLGVPKPTGLTATLDEVDEFTTDDALAADTTVTALIADAIKAAMVDNHYGNAITIVSPTSTNVGWLCHGATTGLPSTSVNQVNFCVPIVGGAMHWAFSFLKDARYGGAEVSYLSQTYYAVAVDLYASIWLPYDVALSDRLGEIKDPSDLTGVADLFDPAEITSIVASCLDYWSTTKEPIVSAISKATAATANIRDVIDSLGAPVSYSTTAYDTAFAAFKGASFSTAGEAFKRVFWESIEYATLPEGGYVATRSRYWAATEATRYANLSADMAACITVDATGFHTFNFAKFQDYLTADFTILINQHTSDKAALQAALAGNVEYCTTPYRGFFSASNLASLGGVQKTDASRTLAFDAAIAAADVAIGDLSNLGALLYSQRTTAAQNAYALGPQARIAAAAVTRIIDTRFYIATHVTDWGEESAPCTPPDSVDVDQNDTVLLTLPSPPSGRNITKWRLYRTNQGSTSASFQFVMEQAVATLTYTDSVKAADLGEVCPSIGPDGLAHWDEPATRLNNTGTLSSKANPYLRGLVGMPNGIMAGFVDNFVAFCDPYHPYAWPVAYQVPIEYPITGLGVFGQTLFVGTIANPYFISGADSASMTAVKLDASQACVSARSIAAATGGVLYASPDGICFASSNGVEVITTALFSREDWQLLTPSSICASMFEGVYYFTYSGNGGGCFALDSIAKKLGRVDITATALFSDALTDALFYVSGTSVKRAFSTGRRTGYWKSAKIVAPAQTPLAWLQVDGTQSVGTPATVRWYGDDSTTPKYTATVTGITPVRLPAGRYLEHEIEIESAARITKVLLAGDTQELKSA